MTWKQLLRKIRRADGVTELRQSGSHVQFRLPDNSIETVCDHPSDVPRPLERKILKHLARAGVILSILVAAWAWIF